MENNVIVINPDDNVAVALRPIKAGERVVGAMDKEITANADIPQSHKIAIIDISESKKVIKYGEPIGPAKENIKAGDWVHTHNIITEEG